jgi:uncharacterized protein
MKLNVPMQQIAAFCERWNVTEFALFGSALRDDFRPDSDVDVMLTYGEGARVTLFDVAEMRDELQELFGRRVDVVSREGVERSTNPFRKRAILTAARTIYAAA